MKSERRQFRNGQWDQKLPLQLNSPNTLVIGFFDRQLDLAQVRADLKEAFPDSIFMGCSTAGEIYDSLVFDQSFSCLIVQFDKTKMKFASVEITDSSGSFAAGSSLGQQLLQPDLKSIFILSDGLNVNGTDLSKGLQDVFSKAHQDIVISGGLSGDGSRFENTMTFDSNSLQSRKILALGFYGQHFQAGTGYFGGWDQFGPARKVTKAIGNILHQIDGEPALTLYKSYLGEESKNLPASALLFPLLIKQPGKVDLVRTVLSVSESDQTMTFAGDIPAGSDVHLMRANFSRIIQGASKAGELASQVFDIEHQKGSQFAIAVSCVGRRLVLGQRTDDELEALKESLGTNIDLIGFYSYGELAGNGVSNCELHNQTMTVTIFREDP